MAFAVLGVALSGLAPVVVAQLRMTAEVENLLPAGSTHYLVPVSGAWHRKLGVDAGRYDTDIPFGGDPAAGTANIVTIEAVVDLTGPDDSASVEVLVEEIPPP
ncbi:hypothetical protein [Tautonia sociabilis]|uniref:Uncharacterized protein n=1 Tax=Tautonia sociabilis TaxID=2080755 RepID=A0A432MET4_9BACT|nr:hypothetical protein [Tautonia sociabilis]RUL84182.1 hypothetical protein TsocGM_20875 [Tautonia sociabilis]